MKLLPASRRDFWYGCLTARFDPRARDGSLKRNSRAHVEKASAARNPEISEPISLLVSVSLTEVA